MQELLLTGAFNYSAEQVHALKRLGYKITFVQEERQELDFDVSIFDAVVCNALFLYNAIEEFTNLKKIQLTSAGFDRVPLKYIEKNNIQLYNAKSVYSIPMAEWAVLKILEIYKKSRVFYQNQEQQIWRKERELFELTDKTISIIGYGNVGQEIAKRLNAFGTQIIGVDIREIQSEYLDQSFPIEELEMAIELSDVVILTLPLTLETQGLIDKKVINRMKDDAILVNLARGGLIKEADLVHALDQGKLLGVALDVFEVEPLEESPLWKYSNVVITPHNSFVSDKVNGRLFELMIKNLRQ